MSKPLQMIIDNAQKDDGSRKREQLNRKVEEMKRTDLVDYQRMAMEMQRNVQRELAQQMPYMPNPYNPNQYGYYGNISTSNSSGYFKGGVV